MDEEKTEDKVEDKKPTTEDTGEGIQPKTISELDRAEAANKEKKELLEREEKLQVRKEKLHAIQMVGGRAEAGQVPKEETEDEKWEKDAKKRYEGTGMDPTPDDSVTEFK